MSFSFGFRPKPTPLPSSLSGVNPNILGYDTALHAGEFGADQYLDADMARMVQFTPAQKELFQLHVAQNAPPKLSRYIEKGANREDQESWTDWLTQQRPDGSPIQTSYAALRSVLTWHVADMIDMRQDPKMQASILGGKLAAKVGVMKQVAKGTLSERASAAPDTIDETTLFFTDPFDPVVDDESIEGYHVAGETSVSIVAFCLGEDRSGQIVDKLVETGTHEYAHRTISSRIQDIGRARYLWFEEEVGTSQTTWIMGGGDSSSLAATGNKRYPGFCDARHALNIGPYGIEDAAVFTRAYSGTPDELNREAVGLDRIWRDDNVLNKFRYVVNLSLLRSETDEPDITLFERQGKVGAQIAQTVGRWREQGIPRSAPGVG